MEMSVADTTTVHVALGTRSYDIVIGSSVLNRVVEYLIAESHASHAIIISDQHVARIYGDALQQDLAKRVARTALIEIAAGEPSKSVAEADRLWQLLLERGADRNTCIVAVGGGVVGDLAGFVAASYARGLSLIQVPTTLLAQVDSSVGGKVGVNLPGAKNMVGAFWQPSFVLIDTNTLDTLPPRELSAGLAEVVKYGVILDAELFEYLERHASAVLGRDRQVLRHVIARCCRLKADVVEADEREITGRRAVLNYGHTFGHAIEAVTHYGHYLHGEAVAIGMHAAARLARQLARVDQSFVDRQAQLLTQFELPTTAPSLAIDALLAAMQRDKKATHGRLRFVLPTRLGEVELVEDVPIELVRSVLEGSG
jgi:3-dehydroquinate synthase